MTFHDDVEVVLLILECALRLVVKEVKLLEWILLAVLVRHLALICLSLN